MTGADAAKAICKDQRTAGIPIVGCSAFLGLEWREVALRAGMVELPGKTSSRRRNPNENTKVCPV